MTPDDLCTCGHTRAEHRVEEFGVCNKDGCMCRFFDLEEEAE